ncbi:hypothetical protein NEUTE1DRAFT_116429 [Neurospora tetrasperma FGSC 2508]|uniref:Uncharacterized protein n=1 Tax=Neurospora tetrasperma (strain FGSC 2508 / ATCC MYA-4615 / P0657) TaxID=510951 RepID=F8MFC2_NEUT8|nr:uncharacterized protein NEUTE1DRAFT_116429 [Neurospora tetrasperma FGSC 2508]EGO59181.1 hypothetical protein NEUTE1DRAFT_116429 [Neurospora tetrasperma FGSC 2508]EGZ73292.1 hypothetical protein NEUTE2DRAFT_144124 [Neurospora tetrasperma FGSC 2509]
MMTPEYLGYRPQTAPSLILLETHHCNRGGRCMRREWQKRSKRRETDVTEGKGYLTDISMTEG